MAASTDAYEAQSIYTSAMLTSHGLLSRVIEEAPASGLRSVSLLRMGSDGAVCDLRGRRARVTWDQV